MAKTYATAANARKALPKDWMEALGRRNGGVVAVALPNGRFVPMVYTGYPDSVHDHSMDQFAINLNMNGWFSVSGVMPTGMADFHKEEQG